jgi:hypothetical protein
MMISLLSFDRALSEVVPAPAWPPSRADQRFASRVYRIARSVSACASARPASRPEITPLAVCRTRTCGLLPDVQGSFFMSARPQGPVCSSSGGRWCVRSRGPSGCGRWCRPIPRCRQSAGTPGVRFGLFDLNGYLQTMPAPKTPIS